MKEDIKNIGLTMMWTVLIGTVIAMAMIGLKRFIEAGNDRTKPPWKCTCDECWGCTCGDVCRCSVAGLEGAHLFRYGQRVEVWALGVFQGFGGTVRGEKNELILEVWLDHGPDGEELPAIIPISIEYHRLRSVPGEATN